MWLLASKYKSNDCCHVLFFLCFHSGVNNISVCCSLASQNPCSWILLVLVVLNHLSILIWVSAVSSLLYSFHFSSNASGTASSQSVLFFHNCWMISFPLMITGPRKLSGSYSLRILDKIFLLVFRHCLECWFAIMHQVHGLIYHLCGWPQIHIPLELVSIYGVDYSYWYC